MRAGEINIKNEISLTSSRMSWQSVPRPSFLEWSETTRSENVKCCIKES